MTDRSNSPQASTAGRTLPALLALAVFAGLIGLGLQTFEASPDPQPADAPPEAFSAARALEHVRVLAQEPRPTGSPALAQARDYLVAQLSSLDLDPQVRRSRLLFPWRGIGALQYVTVENIVARLPGTGDGKAVMLVSHYDSVPTGPGAADDGAGVAAMLETARALRQGQGQGGGLTNDIIFLFTDAEELGLVGARAFVDSDPWLGDVGMVLNFEARGRGGAARMFRTSQDNGWLVDRLAETPAPVATSLSYEVFKYMPNDTDFTIFEGRGLPGMDFAFIDGFPNYHSALDTVEALDPASLQHHGSYMLSLALSLGQADLSQARSQGDKVYFNPLGSWLVSYSGTLALALAILAAVLWVVSWVLARRRRRISVKSVLAGFFGGLLSAVVAGGGCFFLWQQAGSLDVDFQGFFPFGMGYEMSVYAWGFGLVALGLTWLACRLLLPRDGVLGFALGSTLLWVVLTLATTFLLPGVSYLFLWPTLFAFAFILGSALRQPPAEFGEEPAEQRLAATGMAAVAALPVLLLFPPLAALLFSALGLALAP
ncbi:MAG: M20/M25/M40 family metallo-hydrolase, partial [Acidobacteriota bacterium]|nr:M20/M25/M40 family metallo-hydrolase [Acidobacteriota bacterium]